MYSTIKMLHSFWAYLVLIMLIVAVVNALIGLTGKKEYSAKDFRISLFTLIVSHIQLLLGLILYFVSPMFDMWSSMGSEVMKTASVRLYLVEHPLINIIAVALITIGYAKHKKKRTSSPKFKTIFIFYAIALLCFLSRIPWDVWPRF
jgi:heme A synthase